MAQGRKDDPPSQTLRMAADALTRGVELVVALAIGVLLGTSAQERWPQIAPWGVIVGFLIGAGALARSVWRWKIDLDAYNAPSTGSKDDEDGP